LDFGHRSRATHFFHRQCETAVNNLALRSAACRRRNTKNLFKCIGVDQISTETICAPEIDSRTFIHRAKYSAIGMSLSIGDGEENNTMRFLAETESLKPEEASTLVGMLREMGLIDGSFALGGYASVHPTVAGWQEIERLGRPQADSAQAFVAMWFDESTNDAYFRGIAPAVSGMGYKSVRIDKMEHNNKIGDEIIAEIRRSRFLVADFTCQAGKVRGGSLL